jgi:hypothetical protein
MTTPSDPLAERGRFLRQTYRELVDLIQPFEAALARVGLRVESGTPVDALITSMMEMSVRWDREGDLPVTDDRRTEIAECAAFADLMTKIVAVREHPEFEKLREHLELVVGREPFVQHYFTRREDQNANKVFELYIATLALLAGGSITVDSPRRSRGDNPDVITQFNGRSWGLACKVLHSDNPRGYRDHLVKGVEQIEAAPAVDRGVVVFNLKNRVPHATVWPLESDPDTGAVIDYHWFESHETPVQIAAEWATSMFLGPVIEEFGGQAAVDAFFRGKKAAAQTLNFVPVITGCIDKGQRAYTKLNIFKKLAVGTGPTLPETQELLQALSHAANHRAEHAVRSERDGR